MGGAADASFKLPPHPGADTYGGGLPTSLFDTLHQPRQCLKINEHGHTKVIEVTRHDLVESLGVPYRDIRVLDPAIRLTHTEEEALIVSRGDTIVVVLESLRALITARYVLLFAAPPPSPHPHGGGRAHPHFPLGAQDLVAAASRAGSHAGGAKGKGNGQGSSTSSSMRQPGVGTPTQAAAAAAAAQRAASGDPSLQPPYRLRKASLLTQLFGRSQPYFPALPPLPQAVPSSGPSSVASPLVKSLVHQLRAAEQARVQMRRQGQQQARAQQHRQEQRTHDRAVTQGEGQREQGQGVAQAHGNGEGPGGTAAAQRAAQHAPPVSGSPLGHPGPAGTGSPLGLAGLTAAAERSFQSLASDVSTCSVGGGAGAWPMPFEFVVLEACLDVALGEKRAQISALEAAAGPLLDALVQKVHRTTLDAVRSMKQSLYRQLAKVERLLEELTDLMDDEEEMAECYLSRRDASKRFVGLPATASTGTPTEEEEEEDEAVEAPEEEQPWEGMSRSSSSSSSTGVRGGSGGLAHAPPLEGQALQEGSASQAVGHGGAADAPDWQQQEWLSWRAVQARFRQLGFRVSALRPLHGRASDMRHSRGLHGTAGTRVRGSCPNPERALYCIDSVRYDVSGDVGLVSRVGEGDESDEDDARMGSVAGDSEPAPSLGRRQHRRGSRVGLSRHGHLPSHSSLSSSDTVVGTVLVMPHTSADRRAAGSGSAASRQYSGSGPSARELSGSEPTATRQLSGVETAAAAAARQPSRTGPAAPAGQLAAAGRPDRSPFSKTAHDAACGLPATGGTPGGAAGGGTSKRETVRLEVIGRPDEEQLEDLLEYYYTVAQLLRSRLLQLKERTDDAEDLVNIEMDHRRNELVALQLVATIAALGLAIIAAVAGLFGMNLENRMSESYTAFVVVCSACAAACIGVVGLFMWYAQHRGLLFIPDVQVALPDRTEL